MNLKPLMLGVAIAAVAGSPALAAYSPTGHLVATPVYCDTYSDGAGDGLFSRFVSKYGYGVQWTGGASYAYPGYQGAAVRINNGTTNGNTGVNFKSLSFNLLQSGYTDPYVLIITKGSSGTAWESYPLSDFTQTSLSNGFTNYYFLNGSNGSTYNNKLVAIYIADESYYDYSYQDTVYGVYVNGIGVYPNVHSQSLADCNFN